MVRDAAPLTAALTPAAPITIPDLQDGALGALLAEDGRARALSPQLNNPRAALGAAVQGLAPLAGPRATLTNPRDLRPITESVVDLSAARRLSAQLRALAILNTSSSQLHELVGHALPLAGSHHPLPAAR